MQSTLTTPKDARPTTEPMERREYDLHDRIKADCRRMGWKYVYSDPTRPTTCGEGVCDFIIYADGGRMFHVECKSASGKLSLEQQSFIAWVNKLGHTVKVVRNFTEYLEAIK